MIEVRIEDMAAAGTDALLRPIAGDWAAVTPAMRRLEQAAGPQVEEQCQRLGELPVGSAAITGAGALPARFMVHVVVRTHEHPVSAASVRQALINGLRRVGEWGIGSVAMPPVGTGAGNLDPETAAEIMASVLAEAPTVAPRLERIVVVVENEYERDVFERAVRGARSADARGP